MAEKKRAYGYIRVSTARQRDEGYSPEAQTRKITSYCEDNNLELVKIIDDSGRSGKDDKRPGYQELLTLMREGEAEAVVIYKLDRLARSLKHFIIIFDEIIMPREIGFHSVVDKIDTSSAMGRFFLKFMALLAELERELTVERTNEIIALKRDKGEYIGGLPLGFQKSANKQYTIDPEEWKTVTEIFRRREEGQSYRAIARYFENIEAKTKRGGQWGPNTIMTIIRNPIYKEIMKKLEEEDVGGPGKDREENQPNSSIARTGGEEKSD